MKEIEICERDAKSLARSLLKLEAGDTLTVSDPEGAKLSFLIRANKFNLPVGTEIVKNL